MSRAPELRDGDMSLVDTRDDFERTVLNAVRSPLVLGDLSKHFESSVKQFINDTLFCALLQVLECILSDDIVNSYYNDDDRAALFLSPELQVIQSHGTLVLPIYLSTPCSRYNALSISRWVN